MFCWMVVVVAIYVIYSCFKLYMFLCIRFSLQVVLVYILFNIRYINLYSYGNYFNVFSYVSPVSGGSSFAKMI